MRPIYSLGQNLLGSRRSIADTLDSQLSINRRTHDPLGRCKTLKLPPRHAPDAHPRRGDVLNEFEFGSGYVAEVPVDKPGIVMAVARHTNREEAKPMEPSQG